MPRASKFFWEKLSNFNSGYPAIFRTDEEEAEEEEDSKVRGDDKAVVAATESYFGWLSWVSSVSEAQRISWDEVWKKDIYEFFNTVSFLKWKADKQKENIERWKNTH